MRFAEFIQRNMETVLAEWEQFAASLLPGAAGMASPALRDHAQQILEAVARDLSTFQSQDAQSKKSKGRGPEQAGYQETAAQTHAVLRARSGFDINQLVAEYRALRASVLRLWINSSPVNEPGVEEVLRFNEAIDQAVTESVHLFHAEEERARNLLLGMLGHDMRTPLSSIMVTAAYLAALNAGDEVSVAADRLMRSSASIASLLDDLVDFNRVKLGLGVNVVPSEIDLATVVTDEVAQLRAAHPNRRIELAATGDHRGKWDGARLKQVLRNLVSNAIKYGAPSTPVRVTLRGEEAGVWLEVTNSGPPIDPSTSSQMFDPLKRGSAAEGSPGAGDSVGLGLFIVREIVVGHGGDIEVRGDGRENTFAVYLPRRNVASST